MEGPSAPSPNDDHILPQPITSPSHTNQRIISDPPNPLAPHARKNASKRRGAYHTTSEEERSQIVHAVVVQKMTYDTASRQFNLRKSTIQSVIERFRKRGTIAAQHRGGRRQTMVQLTEEDGALIDHWIDQDPSISVKAISDRLQELHGPDFQVSSKEVAKRMRDIHKSRKLPAEPSVSDLADLLYQPAIQTPDKSPDMNRGNLLLTIDEAEWLLDQLPRPDPEEDPMVTKMREKLSLLLRELRKGAEGTQ